MALKVALGTLRPEAPLARPDGQLRPISDGGGVLLGNKACKDTDKYRRAFRTPDFRP